MLSRKHRRTLVLSLMLAAGSFVVPPTMAASGRGHSQTSGTTVQTDLFTRSLIETVKNLWGLLKDAPSGPPQDPKPDNREGSGMCPIGHPHPPGP